MTDLERKKIQLELKRVDMNKDEMQIRIDECNEELARFKETLKTQEIRKLEEIARLQDNVKIQEAKIKELKEKLAQ